MDTSKSETVRFGISTNEMVMVLLNGTLLHYYLVFVVNSHVKDPGQSLMNDSFTLVSMIKSTFKA